MGAIVLERCLISNIDDLVHRIFLIVNYLTVTSVYHYFFRIFLCALKSYSSTALGATKIFLLKHFSYRGD